MNTRKTSRLLSIGEFATATQLSPKALRLYDENCILRPAVVDAGSGYRYYRDDQVPLGRLIRALREMELQLAGVLDVVSASDTARAETLLRQFAHENEQRIARQRRAYQAALELLRTSTPTNAPTVSEHERPTMTVAVRAFLAEQRFLVERFRTELTASYAALAEQGATPAGEPLCILIDPMSDEEGRLEAAIPLASSAPLKNIAVRQLPARRCAVLATDCAESSALDLASSLDVLFDWFDRRGYRAAESPTVSFTTRDSGLGIALSWAFDPLSPTSAR